MTPYYEQSGVTIYHCACEDVLLPHMADHVITDPPYDAQTHAGARSAKHATKGQLAGRLPIDFEPSDPAVLGPTLLSVARRWVVCFCSMEMLGDYRRAVGKAWVRSGFWRKPNGAPQFTGTQPGQPGEAFAIFHGSSGMRWNGGGKHAYYEYNVVHGPERVHPTQKPEKLMVEIVADFTDVGDIILDPFMGSGTTLVAAKRLGRKAIGIETDERQCEHAVRRLQQETLPMFEGSLLDA